jgi:hypothetical protein
MSPELAHLAQELLATLPWSIILPAGCGKTELIAAIATRIEPNIKPLLVLTHTNAGVDVIRERFTKYSVKSSQACVLTLDAWAKLFDDHFPFLGGMITSPPEANQWLGIRLRTKAIMNNKHIRDIIVATYSAVIIDEYQDCSDLQHEIVVIMSKYLPIGVMGDPLQGIFDFGDGVVNWENVNTSFVPKKLEPVPYRWVTKNPTLGTWLIELRAKLIVGATINLLEEGIPITWQQSTTDLQSERKYCLDASKIAVDNKKQVVVLRDLPEQCHKFARGLFGQFNVAEEIELKVAKKLTIAIDTSNGREAAAETLEFIRNCCIGCSAFDKDLVIAYRSGNTHLFRKGNKNAEAFKALNGILTEPTAKNVKNALLILENSVKRIYRIEAWHVVIRALQEAIYCDCATSEKLKEIRNRRKYVGQKSNRNIISRTLLVKGQEYDECIILGADDMNIRNLYVALSRGIDKVTVFSKSPILTLSSY